MSDPESIRPMCSIGRFLVKKPALTSNGSSGRGRRRQDGQVDTRLEQGHPAERIIGRGT